MAQSKTVCKDREMALAILRTITEGMKAGTQKDALESVVEWLQDQWRYDVNFFKMTSEERIARINELLEKGRDRTTTEEHEGKSA